MADNAHPLRGNRGGGVVSLTCASCGVGFTRYRSEAKKAVKHYCSSESPVLLGLDLGSRTGWATYQRLGNDRHPRVRCGLLHAKGDDRRRLASDYMLKMQRLLKETQPDHIAIEGGVGINPGGVGVEDDPRALVHGRFKSKGMTNANTLRLLAGFEFAVLGLAGMRAPSRDMPDGIPVTEVAISTWRKSFLGMGRAPQEVPKKDRRLWLKKAAKDKAQDWGDQWGFELPTGDREGNAAEAVGIVCWLAAHVEKLQAEADLLTRIHRDV